ncbi:MAG: PASTA domain-containing protein [Oscillospiraceae bacterium]|nr:PASTA domain-containing protein [Oscillospiraceae bacterium]
MKKKGVVKTEQTGAVVSRVFVLLLMFGVAAFGALAWKLFDIQVSRHGELQAKAIEQQTRESVVRASRGTIYDINGKALAVSATAETVYIDPYMLKLNGEDAFAIATRLSELLGVERGSILTKFENTKQRGLPIKRKIEGEEAAAVRQYIVDGKLTSVYLAEDSKRYYPQSSLASSVIGFVGTDNYGLEGLEAKYDGYLTGTDGRVVRLKNVAGTDMLFSDYENYFDAENGCDITLTIDSTIQYYLEKHLKQAVADFNARAGAAAIAMDPKTGAILGMVSLGNYDLNAPFDVSAEVMESLAGLEGSEYSDALAAARQLQWRNKAISDTYEPGSVFKIMTLAMALEEGLVNESSTFFCGGQLDGVPGRTGAPYHCWKTAGHGQQTLTEAVQNSCNVAFINIGLRVGAEAFYKYVEAFGFFNKTGVDLSGESASIWWTPEVFKEEDNKTQLASASFGQTFNITPIQLITAVSAVINGGNMYTPHIVKTVTDANGGIVMNAEPSPVRQVVSEKTSETVREILENVVSHGTGGNAYVEGYRVGGKTGTTTDTVKEANEGVREYKVSFCGAAPMDDPRLVVLVLLDNPPPIEETGIYVSGGNMAAPVVGRIMSEALPYLGVVPHYTEEEAGQLNVSVPRLEGKSEQEAAALLDKTGLAYRIVGDGASVTDQLPAPNASVSPGTKVIIYLGGQRPDIEDIIVPSLMGLSYSDAKRALENAGLFIRSVGVPAHVSGAAVSVQSVQAGNKAPPGAVIEVTLIDKSIQGQY